MADQCVAWEAKHKTPTLVRLDNWAKAQTDEEQQAYVSGWQTRLQEVEDKQAAETPTQEG